MRFIKIIDAEGDACYLSIRSVVAIHNGTIYCRSNLKVLVSPETEQRIIKYLEDETVDVTMEPKSIPSVGFPFDGRSYRQMLKDAETILSQAASGGKKYCTPSGKSSLLHAGVDPAKPGTDETRLTVVDEAGSITLGDWDEVDERLKDSEDRRLGITPRKICFFGSIEPPNPEPIVVPTPPPKELL